MNTADILVLFYSRYGATRDLARLIAEGIESVPGASARLRCVPAVSAVCEASEPAVPADAQWLSGALIGKPACVFTSTGSVHGGQETTLLSMMIPLMHHGMLLVGLPYSEPDLMTTTTGGSPYGVTHVAHADGRAPISAEEKRLAIAQGKRLAQIALQLKSAR
jgi:NAD(P)H dehydrogenase (quinone)